MLTKANWQKGNRIINYTRSLMRPNGQGHTTCHLKGFELDSQSRWVDSAFYLFDKGKIRSNQQAVGDFAKYCCNGQAQSLFRGTLCAGSR